MKSSKKKLSPDDAELRKSVKPVICYPTDSLKSPNMNDYLIARKNLKKIDQIIIPPRDAKCFRVPKSHFFRIYCQNGPQVGDLNLWNEHNLNEKFYSGKTRALYGTHLSTNDRLWSSLPYLRPMATITHDTLDWYGFDDDGGSVHDVIGTRCDPYTEKILSNKEYHFCCHSNLIRALSNYKNQSSKKILLVQNDTNIKTIIVTGKGDSEENAAMNAAQNALLMASPRYIKKRRVSLYKETSIDGNLIPDESIDIYRESSYGFNQGSILSFKVTKTSNKNNVFSVVAIAKVSYGLSKQEAHPLFKPPKVNSKELGIQKIFKIGNFAYASIL